jgi:hypothetical protein
MEIIIPSGYLNKFVKNFNLKCSLPIFEKKDLYLSSKAGPQGKSTLTSLNNLLFYDDKLINNIKNITSKEGYDYLLSSIELSKKLEIKPDLDKCQELGKISFIKDPEAKLRLVAISDYFTQVYLKKIHSALMNIIKNIPNDRTFTQDPFFEWNYKNNESF